MKPFQLTLADDERDELSMLSPNKRLQFDRWRCALLNLQANRSDVNECARELGVHWTTVYKKLDAVRHHGWRALAPARKGPKGLCNEFVEFFRKLTEENQRGTAAAIRVLQRKWLNREPIPGYTGHPGHPNFPSGWRNLYRYMPPKIQTVAMRRGMSVAISLHGPKTFTTRVGLWPMSHVMFDDVRHDNFVHVFTGTARKGQVCRVDELGALDVLSGSRFCHGMRPRLKRDDGTETGLMAAEMRFLVAQMLWTHGYNADRGTTFILEHGTAALNERAEQILRRGLGDKISFSRSGIVGEMQAVAGLQLGRGVGNFRHKSALESWHNLMHNELAALPGQTGKDVEHRPEHLHGLLKEAADLLKAIELLPAMQRDLFKLPTLEFFTEFSPAVAQIYRLIDARTDHNLEGWERCGFTTSDYRLHEGSAEWLGREQFLALPDGLRAQLALAARANPALQRPRRLSPGEVYALGRGSLHTAPMGVIAELLYDDLFQERKARDGYFIFHDSEIAPDELRFEARVTTPDDHQYELVDGETYEVVINPFDTRQLWVFSGAVQRGGFLGVARQVPRPSRSDTDAITREWGRQKQRVAELLHPLRKRHAGIAREAATRARTNADVLEDAAGIRSEADRKRVARAFADGANELLGDDEALAACDDGPAFSADELLD